MNALRTFLAASLCLLSTAAVRAETTVTVNHNDPEAAGPDFHFKEVSAPRRSAAIGATFSVVDGSRDPNGGSADVLHNGDLPGEEDQPAANFFFAGEGGRVVADLGAVIPVKEVDTYSWHSDVRAPQVYKLYGSDGSGGAAFNARPARPVDPASAGWKLLATVDTRTRFGLTGGQYGVSVADPAGSLGRFRFLLFDMARTTRDHPFDGTFYGEIAVLNADAASNPPIVPAKTESKTYEENGLRLVITNDDPTFDPAEQERLARTFFTVYPQLMRDFNPAASKSVRFSIESKYRGVAAASGTRIVMNPRWFHQNPNDVDVVTHEGMHVVQAYRQWDPGWLTEGIADYVRARYGVNNAAAHWSMPDYEPKQNYTDAYRVTARFLTWLERHVKPGLVVALDRSMREGNYSADTWKQQTGKSVDELWQAYGQNPAL